MCKYINEMFMSSTEPEGAPQSVQVSRLTTTSVRVTWLVSYTVTSLVYTVTSHFFTVTSLVFSVTSLVFTVTSLVLFTLVFLILSLTIIKKDAGEIWITLVLTEFINKTAVPVFYRSIWFISAIKHRYRCFISIVTWPYLSNVLYQFFWKRMLTGCRLVDCSLGSQ